MMVRRGTKDDIPAVFTLVEELAIYERAAHEVDNSVDRMLEDGFGERPVFEFFVAEHEGELVGLALFYYRYSTWKGKCLYLEDLVVTEAFRRQGIGKKLFDAIVKEARRVNAYGIDWQVLDWNEPAIAFYKKLDVKFNEGWVNVRMNRQQLEAY